jgi:aldehyde dehydrogenase (NAD+)
MCGQCQEATPDECTRFAARRCSRARLSGATRSRSASITATFSPNERRAMDQAVAAARRAFPAYSATTRRQRLGLLRRIIKSFEARSSELARAMTAEMGSPITFSNKVQTVNALAHFKEMISVLKAYKFERFMGDTLILREPIGVCGLITPWNWPLNQITSKLSPALAAVLGYRSA